MIEELSLELESRKKGVRELEERQDKSRKEILERPSNTSNRSNDLSDEKVRSNIEKLKGQLQLSNGTIEKLKVKLDAQETEFIERALAKDREISQMKNQLQFLSSDFEAAKSDSEKSISEGRKAMERSADQFKRKEIELTRKIEELTTKYAESCALVR